MDHVLIKINNKIIHQIKIFKKATIVPDFLEVIFKNIF